MTEYIATFHTHLSAMLTQRTLTENNITAVMEPVPRALSSSCGSCVRFWAEIDFQNIIDGDCQAVYMVYNDKEYSLFLQGE